jgi:S1-C subfamily serine protease
MPTARYNNGTIVTLRTYTTAKILYRRLRPGLYSIVGLFVALGHTLAGETAGLSDTVAKIKPSIVAIGSVEKTRRPPSIFRGTGFVIGDGLHVATNAHAILEKLNQDKNEVLAVFAGDSKSITIRPATKIAEDRDHDLAILRISGPPLPALTLGDSERVREGEFYAFTGFPIGMVLGLNAVTHSGLISAITPIVIPQLSAEQLDKKTLARLIAPYDVFQLDATAYPGNSGSPLYHPDTGYVVGILNKVLVRQSKEGSLKEPSGITYAIPIRHLRNLLQTLERK